MKKTLFLALAAVMAFSTTALAGSPWTEADSYSEKTTQKLEYGMKNLLGGWTEIFVRPEAYADEGKNAVVGFGHGLANFVVYTVGGALHTGTFFIPVDIPLPNGGVDIS